jgi:dTDP-4-dehydrorhamnose 3,5-epimerase
MSEPKLIDGGSAIDDRGKLRFFMKDIPWDKIKRFYTVKNWKDQFCRAFHGHAYESKWVFVIKGAVIFKLTPLDNLITITNDGTVIENPVKNVDNVKTFVLDENSNKMLYIPAGYFNGFKTLTPDAEVQFFSDKTVDESKGDDFRFDINKFNPLMWTVKER